MSNLNPTKVNESWMSKNSTVHFPGYCLLGIVWPLPKMSGFQWAKHTWVHLGTQNMVKRGMSNLNPTKSMRAECKKKQYCHFPGYCLLGINIVHVLTAINRGSSFGETIYNVGFLIQKNGWCVSCWQSDLYTARLQLQWWPWYHPSNPAMYLYIAGWEVVKLQLPPFYFKQSLLLKCMQLGILMIFFSKKCPSNKVVKECVLTHLCEGFFCSERNTLLLVSWFKNVW